MLANKEIVHKLIPQEEPMLMVDTLIEHIEDKTLTGFYIDTNNIFNTADCFSAEGLLENMAQSAALRSGWLAAEKAGKDGSFSPPVGFIGSVKKFIIHRLPKINTYITTEITAVAEIFNATMITARIMQNKDILAEAELKIFLNQ